MAGRAERAFREGMAAPVSSRSGESDRDDEREADWDSPRRARRPEPYDDEQTEARDGNGHGPNPRREMGRGRRPFPVLDPYAVSDTYTMALKRSTDLVSDQLRAFQIRASRFISRRVERDMDAMAEIAQSRSLFEIFGAQQKWISGLASDYGDEMIRLGKIAGHAIEDSVAAERMHDR